MRVRRGAVYGAITIITLVTLLSGPLVGAVDLTSEPDTGITDDLGNGSADVSVLSFPETASISEGRFGSEQLYLRVPDATYRLSNVSGQPSIEYTLLLEENYYSTSTTSFVTAAEEGRRTASLDRVTFQRSELQRDRYNATLSLVLRANGNETVIREERFVVEVEE